MAKMKSSNGKAKKEAKVPGMKKEPSGMTAAQKKLPPALQKAIAAKKFKPVLQFDKQNNFIKEWDSAKEAAIAMGRPGSDDIGACCRGRQKTAHGFIWKFKQ